VTFVAAAIDLLSRTFAIEVHVANPEGDIKPAMLVELHVPIAQHENALTLPRSAVVLDELGPGVFVVKTTADGTIAERRPVVLGANAIGFVVVESGIDPGDQVIIQGQHSVSDGDAVEVSASHLVPPGAEALVSGLGSTS
jgi:multidrug efflux pump subunit AcrA (membrane-fusion protein)